jgi:NAD(P)-dependent dehydrogenase (short-subunit alcohol dehydrogenase family)
MTPSRAVLVTGCSSGIGRAAALRLHRAGLPVYATARRPETLGELADAGIPTLPLDVTDEDSMRAAVQRVEDDHGAAGVLVNNAGYALQGPVEEAALDDVRQQFETNVFGLVRLTQLVLPKMRGQAWGRVVNVSSMGGRLTFPGGAFYHASKHAVEAVSDALRLEVAPFGVRVVLVEPGPVRTEFGHTAVATIAGLDGPYARFRDALADRYAQAYEARRASLVSSPEDVAATIERAVRAARPRARYPVGPVARGLLGLRRALPDRAFDAFLRTQWPTP